MKRSYQKPVMEMETFAPNEYIAACYAIVDVNDSTNFTIKQGWNGNPTDGMNSKSGGAWNWLGKGFEDDNLDTLSTDYAESTNGLFYNGPGMEHTTEVSAWEANGDTDKGDTMKKYTATEVKVVTLTDDNYNQYGFSANAS